MFDPDDLKKELSESLKKVQVRQSRSETPNLTKPKPPDLLSEKEKLRYYLKECSHSREGYGFKMENGKLVIADLEKLNRFDSATKAILRELYLELK